MSDASTVARKLRANGMGTKSASSRRGADGGRPQRTLDAQPSTTGRSEPSTYSLAFSKPVPSHQPPTTAPGPLASATMYSTLPAELVSARLAPDAPAAPPQWLRAYAGTGMRVTASRSRVSSISDSTVTMPGTAAGGEPGPKTRRTASR